jgi:protease I
LQLENMCGLVKQIEFDSCLVLIAKEKNMSTKMLARFLVHSMILVFLVTLTCGCAQSKNNKVLMLVYEKSSDMEFMLVNELGVMTEMLTKAGYQVITASDSGEQLKGVETTLKPDFKIADVKIEDYVGVIIPCMARPDDSPVSEATLEIIKNANEQGKLIAAQTGGVESLYWAGVLKGKEYAYPEEIEGLSTGSIYKGEGVVQDGNVITGGICPFMEKLCGKKDTTIELTQKFIDALNNL